MNKSNKKPHKISDSHHDEHVDEKWLVSYADMMTLLFGLFVILFSISMENQAQFQDNLKKLSDSTTRNPSNEGPPEPKVERDYEKELKEEQAKAQNAQRQIEQLKEEMQAVHEKLKVSETMAERIAELESVKNSSDQSQVLLAQKNKDIEKIMAEKETLSQEISRLQEDQIKAKELELKISKLEDQVRQNQELEAKIKTQEAELNKSKEFAAKTSALAKENESSEREISSLQANDLKKSKDLKDLSKQLEEARNEVKSLKEELKQTERKNGDNQSYLFVILKWSTEKHDLDLSVIDPAGSEYNFKKKSFAGSPALFSLDSRSGPGAEIWQSSNPAPGTYTVKIKMYNNYGNNEQAIVSGSVFSNKSSIAIDSQKLDSKSGSMITFKISIDEKGMAKLL